MAKRIEQATGVETRASILGHMQRGGNPTAKDRVYASYMGALAVDLLCSGATNRVVLTTISKTHSEWLKTQTSMSLKSLRFQDDNIKPSRTWQTDEEPRISKKEFYSVALNLGYTGFFCLLASFKLALCGPSGKKIERFVEAKGDSVLWLLLIQPRQILDKSSRYPPLLIQKDMQLISKYSPSSCRCRM